jgi:hypothetical protein
LAGADATPQDYLNEENHGEGGDPFTTYFPLPYYVTSAARSLYLKNTEVG